jgi:hypothetical protein
MWALERFRVAQHVLCFSQPRAHTSTKTNANLRDKRINVTLFTVLIKRSESLLWIILEDAFLCRLHNVQVKRRILVTHVVEQIRCNVVEFVLAKRNFNMGALERTRVTQHIFQAARENARLDTNQRRAVPRAVMLSLDDHLEVTGSILFV